VLVGWQHTEDGTAKGSGAAVSLMNVSLPDGVRLLRLIGTGTVGTALSIELRRAVASQEITSEKLTEPIVFTNTTLYAEKLVTSDPIVDNANFRYFVVVRSAGASALRSVQIVYKRN
jgi:hypothetical protein